MMRAATIQISESKIVQAIRRMPLKTKRRILVKLISESSKLDALVVRGRENARRLAAQQGLQWDRLSESARERFVDRVVHEK